MLYLATITASLAALGAAQSTSGAPPTQTSSSPAAPSSSPGSYPGAGAKPGFGILYPKNGSYYGVQPGAKPSIAYYPWEVAGKWSVILGVPIANLNDTTVMAIGIGIYNVNSSRSYHSTIIHSNTTLTPNRGTPATNKTWPVDQYWVDFDPYDARLGNHGDPPIVPGPGYYVTLWGVAPSGAFGSEYAVSELFEVRDTKKADPSLPGGPYGPVHNAAGNLVPSLTLVFLSGAIAAWSLL